jgi:hypothetical protein
MTKPPALGKGGGCRLHDGCVHVVQHEDYFGIFFIFLQGVELPQN